MKIVEINEPYSQTFSSGIGSIRCKYDKLYKLFGEPKELYTGKIDHEWTLILDNGDHINIYDWKIGISYYGKENGVSKNEIEIWNVGSNNPNTLLFLERLLESKDWGGFECTKLKMFMSEDLAELSIERV